MLFLQRKKDGGRKFLPLHGCSKDFWQTLYVLSVFLQRKYTFYHQNTLLDTSRTNSSNIIGRNLLMVIALLANQDFTPMLNCHGTQ